MFFNKNIILEILLNNFRDEICMYIDKCVMRFHEYELNNIFDTAVDCAIFDQIEDMEILEFHMREKNNETVEGVLQVVALIDGYEYMNGQNIYKDSGMTMLGIGK